MRRIPQMVWVVPLALLAGCVTPMTQTRNEDVRRQVELSSLKTDHARLVERVRGMEDVHEDIYRRLDETARVHAAGDEMTVGRLDALDSRVQLLEQQRVSDRQELIDTLSRKMADIVNARPPAPPAGSSSSYLEHTVKQGETLSEIAVVYHVTVEAIVRANQLPDANSIRVGTKLLIPE